MVSTGTLESCFDMLVSTSPSQGWILPDHLETLRKAERAGGILQPARCCGQVHTSTGQVQRLQYYLLSCPSHLQRFLRWSWD